MNAKQSRNFKRHKKYGEICHVRTGERLESEKVDA